MDTADEMQEQLHSFRTHMSALHKQQQQRLAYHYFAGIQREFQLTPAVPPPSQRVVTNLRRVISRHLYGLAKWMDPESSQEKQPADAEATYQVIDVTPAVKPVIVQEKPHA